MAKQRTHNAFRTIDDVLSKEKEFVNLRTSIKNYRVVDEFENIFPELKPVAEAVKAEKQVLFLKVENSVWKSELNLKKNLILEKINKHFKESVVKKIKFL